MEATFLTTAIISTRVVKASLETVLAHDMVQENWEKIHHVLQQVGVIQATLFHIRNELGRLEAENHQLRQQLQGQKA